MNELDDLRAYCKDLEKRLWTIEGELSIALKRLEVAEATIVKLERVKELWKTVVLGQP